MGRKPIFDRHHISTQHQWQSRRRRVWLWIAIKKVGCGWGLSGCGWCGVVGRRVGGIFLFKFGLFVLLRKVKYCMHNPQYNNINCTSYKSGYKIARIEIYPYN